MGTMAPPNWTGPGLMPVNTSPLGSNVSATPPSGETSEESGDDTLHAHQHQQQQQHQQHAINNNNKRPSPEPLTGTAATGGAAKKAKVTQQAKKKKRRDPHEPQK